MHDLLQLAPRQAEKWYGVTLHGTHDGMVTRIFLGYQTTPMKRQPSLIGGRNPAEDPENYQYEYG